MGRELKRVAIGFDWPLQKTWLGYINPYYDLSKECHVCEGMGYSTLALALHKLWYSHLADDARETALSDDPSEARDRVVGFIDRILAQPPIIYHVGHSSRSWADHIEQFDVDTLWDVGRLYDFGQKDKGDDKPSVAQVNAWNIQGMGHDSINHYYCIRERAKLFGFEMICPVCNGDGLVWPNQATLHLVENWEEIQPPEGEGYQLWETVSEGSPVSPVFENAQGLIDWMSNNGYSREGAKKFIESGYAPTFMGFQREDGTGYLTNGIDAAVMPEFE